MPGVPSGRGCDNCRKSKKKCDEAKPRCTRCTRRGLGCIGAGQKRYKFMEEGPPNTEKKPVKKSPPKQQDKPVAKKDVVRRIAVNPSNGTTLIAQRLVAAVKPATSIRYNLMWAYGGYLMLIPRRLGINEALDTAVDAMVTAHQSFASCKEINISSLTKYSRALGALSKCLDNPVTASSSETLCAVSVMLLVQHLVGPADLKWTGHAEGAAKILKARKSCAPRDQFEKILMMALRGPVLFEGFFNPHIQLTQQEWRELVESELDANTPEGDMLLNFSRVRDILERAKSNTHGLAGLLIIQAEMRSVYTKTQKVCDVLGAEMKEVENPGDNGPPNPHGLPPGWIHPHIQRFYGIAITITLYMNYAARVLRIPDPEISSDATHLALEMISLAENAIQYRPFGAGYVVLGLIAAIMAVDSAPLQVLLHSWLDDYREDFNMPTISALHITEAFQRLDPFASQETPVTLSGTEEEAIYDPLLLDDGFATSQIWDVSDSSTEISTPIQI